MGDYVGQATGGGLSRSCWLDCACWLFELPLEDSAGHIGSTVPAGFSTFVVPAGLESPPFLGASFCTYGKFGKLYFSQEHH